MLRIFYSFLLLSTVSALQAQLQSPAAFLGYELGERFSRHHQVVSYFQQIDAASPKVQLQKYGLTYEQRPLLLAFVSTEKNLARLETIREDNLRRAGLLDGTPTTNVALVWLSYNVHGNESVSMEAAMATLYELVREGSEKAAWLENTVVIIDPCINPDGRDRYANFYWEKGNQPYNPDPNSWEHREPWPGGRANHYLFDLNRDWAWQTQVETQQRMKVYNQWLPHVHVDFHEQGVNEPYYFAPAAEPFHELITDWQRDFQTMIGKNNARYFDANNWFYFTKQRFDLLYPSYGDTYPTYNGSIGMTYEQGGSGRAGLGVIKEEGDTLTLTDRIAHHHMAGLSTIEETAKNYQKVLSEFGSFFSQPANSKYKTYVLKFDGNEDKFRDLKQWLDAQGIRYGTTQASKGLSGYHYGSGQNRSFTISANDLVVSINQPKSVLTTILFEPNTWLSDSLTYDITAWAVPYAFGIEAYASTTALTVSSIPAEAAFVPNQPAEVYGYIFPWKSMSDAKLLADLLQANLKVRFTTQPITIEGKTFGRGSFIVTPRDNPDKKAFGRVVEIANEQERRAYPIQSGFVADGPDIGSSDVRFLKTPKVALLGGPGTSSLDYGATWHYMEQNLGYPVTTLSTDYFSGIDLREYDVLVLPGGWYGSLTDREMGKINDWVAEGGTLIAVQGAMSLFSDTDEADLSRFNSEEEKQQFETKDQAVATELQTIPYAESERYEIREYVAGAVFKVSLDNTHPLAYGYDKVYYSLKTSEDRFGYLPSENVGVIQFAQDHLSGFAGKHVLDKVDRSLVFGVERKGRGKIVYMADSPLFRSFWYNGKLLFANALFFVGSE